MIHKDFSTEITVDFSMECNISYDLCNDSSLIFQLKLILKSIYLICTLDSTRFFSCGTTKFEATQRAERAGRTRPGKCYRLYSAKYYDTRPCRDPAREPHERRPQPQVHGDRQRPRVPLPGPAQREDDPGGSQAAVLLRGH